MYAKDSERVLGVRRRLKLPKAQNNNGFVILNVATQESWKNDKGDYENRTEWHRVDAGTVQGV